MAQKDVHHKSNRAEAANTQSFISRCLDYGASDSVIIGRSISSDENAAACSASHQCSSVHERSDHITSVQYTTEWTTKSRTWSLSDQVYVNT